MKQLRRSICLVLVLLTSIFSTLFAQAPPWKKDTNNPVISGGIVNSWNRHLFFPNTLFNEDSSRFEIWFSGASGPPNPWLPRQTGYATSLDGISWNVHPDPIMTPDSGAWDEVTTDVHAVLRENGTYKMWYTGWSNTDARSKFGYATSPDGFNWSKHSGNPVMLPGTDAWEAGGPYSCSIIPADGLYKMWYSGFTADFSEGNIGYATSVDGISWTRDSTNNPVLPKGGAGTWDEIIDVPKVLFIDDVYHMWYFGNSASTDPQIGWATSSDGINWTKYNDPATTDLLYAESDPVIKPSSAQWDANHTGPGNVMLIGDSLHMWYIGNTLTGLFRFKIGHATVFYDGSIVGIQENDPTANTPIGFSLAQNYPNPFNPLTTINYRLGQTSTVQLTIYNLLGQTVRTLVNERQGPGEKSVIWDARDETGNTVGSGIYVYKIHAGEFRASRKMLLVR